MLMRDSYSLLRIDIGRNSHFVVADYRIDSAEFNQNRR